LERERNSKEEGEHEWERGRGGLREREILKNKMKRVRENLQKNGRWEWERKRGREGEIEGEE
jgi:hypothetical protein